MAPIPADALIFSKYQQVSAICMSNRHQNRHCFLEGRPNFGFAAAPIC